MNVRSLVVPAVAAALLLCASQAQAVVTSFSDIEFWVGSGDSEAAFVFDFNDGQDALAWGYRWDSATTTSTGEDILNAVNAADDRLNVTLGSFDFSGTILSYLVSAQYDARSAGDDPLSSKGWFYYNGTAYNSLATSFVGMTTRTLTDGDWDVWAFVDYDPITYAPLHSFGDFAAAQAPTLGGPTGAVPEPASASLLAIGAAGLFFGSRRRRSC